MQEELIQRFFKKECTTEEASRVAEYLKANPALLNKYSSEEEWGNIGSQEMPEEFWNEVWQNIEKKNKSKVIVLQIKRTAVAACIVGLIGVGYYKFGEPAKVNDAVAVNNLPEKNIEHKTTANNSNSMMRILLPDSSTIELSPGSVLRYDMPFPDHKREIFLDGEALFKVAKDTAKPFTVFAGALATTALGTEFKISANSGAQHNIIVKLFEGKVVVKRTDSTLKGWNKNVYLMPGQQLEYNADSMLATILNIDSVDKPKKLPVNIAKKKTITAGTGLVFNSASLPEVFEKLSKYYNVKIEFNKIAIEKMNFTGTINKNDSLAIVLKIITQMNDLEIIEQNDGFLIQQY